MEGNNDEVWFLDNDYIMEDEMGEAEEQLVDEGEHNIPFNVADVPQQLVTADAHTQREVHLGLYEQQPASGQDHVMKFKASGVKGMQMSTLNCRASEAAASDNDGCDSMIGGGPPLECKATAEPVDTTVARHTNMMALGTCMDEQLWVVMVLNKYFEEGYGENREEEVPVLETKTMVLSTEHWYMMIMFITQVLDSMQHEDIHCMVEYPELLTLESIKALMEVLHLSQRLLQQMASEHQAKAEQHEGIPWTFHEQLGGMGEESTSIMEYGQNQPIMVSQAVEEERTNWSRDHDFSYLEVQRWHKVSLERITQNHGEVYDKPEHDTSRVAMDLRELDLLDDDGYEINVYNKAGWALLDLDKVHELFQGRDEVHGEMTNEVEFWVYPLAFMWKYGNVKAHGIILNMAAHIGKLNESIFRGGMEDDDMEVDEGGEERVQNKAKFHSVQLGMMTSALAGAGIEMSYRMGGKDKRMDMWWMGWLTYMCRSIYEEIICPLLKAWSHLQVLGPIKDSLKLFKADVTVRRHEWPVEAETWWPMMSLKQAQQLTYGKVHYEHTRWMMWGDAITEIAQSARKATWAGQSHLTWDEYGHSLGAFFLADVLCNAYKAKFTIKLAIENLLPNAYSHISNALFRQACYAVDMAFRVYFDNVKKLVILVPNKQKFELTTSMLGKKLTSFIADIVIKQCSKDMAHNIPLFIKGGNFIHPSNVVVHEVWLNLGGQAPPVMGSQSMNVPAQQLNLVMAYQALQAIQAGDAHGEWTVAEHLLTEESNVSMVKGAIWRIFGEAGLGGMRVEGEQAAWTIHHDGVRIYHLPDFAAVKGINTFLLAVQLMKSGGMYGGFDAVQYLAGTTSYDRSQYIIKEEERGMGQRG
ncbi:hypothetical protein EDC04DRAFT_2608610 [Pisolithus marmoratus]|nr:hypothetical protein EDC04DRAFT_2608610 [Pisolithus marmoratus]